MAAEQSGSPSELPAAGRCVNGPAAGTSAKHRGRATSRPRSSCRRYDIRCRGRTRCSALRHKRCCRRSRDGCLIHNQTKAAWRERDRARRQARRLFTQRPWNRGHLVLLRADRAGNAYLIRLPPRCSWQRQRPALPALGSDGPTSHSKGRSRPANRTSCRRSAAKSEVASCGMRKEASVIGEFSRLSTSCRGLADLGLHHLRPADRHGVIRMTKDHDTGLAAGIDDGEIGRRVGDVEDARVHIREHARRRIRAGLDGRAPADERNAGRLHRSQRGVLLDRVEFGDDYAVRFQGDSLIEGRRARRNLALAVDDLELPADRRGRLLDPVSDALRAAIPQVAGDIDDRLVGCRSRTRGRTVPRARPLCRRGDPSLGCRHNIVGSGACGSGERHDGGRCKK